MVQPSVCRLPEIRRQLTPGWKTCAMQIRHQGSAAPQGWRGAHHECAAADEYHPSGVAAVRRQAGIGGAASELACSHVLLRDGGGERAGHQTGAPMPTEQISKLRSIMARS